MDEKLRDRQEDHITGSQIATLLEKTNSHADIKACRQVDKMARFLEKLTNYTPLSPTFW